MKLYKDDDRLVYILTCDYSDRTVAKKAGFRWNPVYREWETTSAAVADNLSRHADDEVRAAITKELQEYEQRKTEAEIAEREGSWLLKPECEPASSIAANVNTRLSKSPSGDDVTYITIKFFEKNEDFRGVVKSHGFAWNEIGMTWEKRITPLTGDILDRMADVSQDLVTAGFIVRLWSKPALEKLQAGDFKPEQTRWVLLFSGGEHTGKLCLQYAYGDDLWEFARQIPGASSAGKNTFAIPREAVEEVLDFAERYDFSVAPSALKVLDDHLAKLSSGIVIKAKPKAAKKPLVVVTGSGLSTSTGKNVAVVGVSNELLDD